MSTEEVPMIRCILCAEKMPVDEWDEHDCDIQGWEWDDTDG